MFFSLKIVIFGVINDDFDLKSDILSLNSNLRH